MPTRRAAVLAFALITIVATASRVAAASGDLDPSFGGDGTVEAFPGGYIDVPTSVVVQTDGAVVAAGVSGPTGSDVALVRWESDGDIDATFGGGDGIVTTDFGADDAARAVAAQWDGKIVIAGASGFSYGMDGNVILARYLADGSLDPDFGVGGKVTTDLGQREGAGDVAILLDERIVVAAYALDENTLMPSLVVLRYLADGALDPAFGTGGRTITPIDGVNSHPARLVVQPDGKVVAATTGDDAFVLVRLDVDGDLDPTFGDGGIATIPLPSTSSSALTDLVGLPGDELVASGAYFDAGTQRQNAVLAGIESDGDVDESFGTDGFLFGSLADTNDSFDAMVRQPDDKIVVLGDALRRWFLSGVPDATFGTGGVASGYGSAITQQSDGKLVTARRVCAQPPFCEPGLPCPPTCHFGAARYLDDSPPVPTPTPMPTATPACPAAPAGGCATPAPQAAQLMVAQPGDAAGNRIEWKWKKGSATAFGDPTTTTAYSLCVYDGGALVTTAFARAGGTCNVAKPSPCWRGVGKPPGSKGWQYRDRDRAFDGLTKIQLKPHATPGKASIAVSARGAALDLTALPASPPVTVQLHDGTGTCFAATYSTHVATSTGTLFKAKSD